MKIYNNIVDERNTTKKKKLVRKMFFVANH